VVKQQISRQRQTTQLQIKTLARAATAHNSTHPQGECTKSAGFGETVGADRHFSADGENGKLDASERTPKVF
jgi:hypothetical protein